MGVSNRLLMPNYLHNEFNDPISTPNAKETTIRCPCQELGDLGKRELKKKYFGVLEEIEMFEYRPNDGKMRDFYLKVYWYEKVSKEFESGVDEITKQENEIVAEDEERKEKIIRRHEVLNKANAVKCA
ncbi:hypothetical protein RhiirA5_404442 [Rhizophagus irregularis]|uniref:Uncharacterized protein n=2 Tax=Rhizophagus irregularis TaxID=588596 RepID=A0A2N0NPK2_9GLOM|nr:hypothetical protein RhiirA5_404442 [Rhizophagus irregularis]